MRAYGMQQCRRGFMTTALACRCRRKVARSPTSCCRPQAFETQATPSLFPSSSPNPDLQTPSPKPPPPTPFPPWPRPGVMSLSYYCAKGMLAEAVTVASCPEGHRLRKSAREECPCWCVGRCVFGNRVGTGEPVRADLADE
jgi:hypothetical protein